MKRSGAVLAGLVLVAALAAAEGGSASHQVVMRVLGVSGIALNDTSPILLNLRVPQEGGGVPVGDTDSSKRLWYSSPAAPGETRCIQAHLEGSAPAGADLRVEAVSVQTGAGQAVNGGIVLSAVARDIVTGIPTVFTGRGAGSGAQLRYTLQAADPSRLRIGESATATVVYTLTGS